MSNRVDLNMKLEVENLGVRWEISLFWEIGRGAQIERHGIENGGKWRDQKSGKAKKEIFQKFFKNLFWFLRLRQVG